MYKWIDASSNGLHRERFNTESALYKSGALSGFAPELVLSGENWFVTTRVEGGTLREAVMKALESGDGSLFSDAAEAYFDWQRRWLQASGHGAGDAAVTSAAEIEDYGHRLLKSGPQETHMPLPERFLARLNGVLWKILFVPMLSRGGAFPNVPRTMVHGDLHLNNLIMSGQETYAIDWENAGQGDRMIDTAYSFVMLKALTAAYPPFLKEVVHRFENLLMSLPARDQHRLTLLCSIFWACIETNRRFWPEPSGGRFHWLQLAWPWRMFRILQSLKPTELQHSSFDSKN